MVLVGRHRVRRGEAERAVEVELHWVRVVRAERYVFDRQRARIERFGHQFERVQAVLAEDLDVAA